MVVVLKEEFKTENFIEQLNIELANSFGANTSIKFNSWAYIHEQADYLNYNSCGQGFLTSWERPVTKEQIEKNFPLYKFGQFHFDLPGCNSSTNARDAIAVCKWLIKTKCQYIDKIKSYNYGRAMVRFYLNSIMESNGYDMDLLWKIS